MNYYGLNEGDKFRVGFYAIPEYYGMLVNNSYNAGSSGLLNQAGFNQLSDSDTDRWLCHIQRLSNVDGTTVPLLLGNHQNCFQELRQ